MSICEHSFPLREDSVKMEGEVMANPDLDVTIYLVQKSTTEQAAGSTGTKKRRISIRDVMDSYQVHGLELPLGKVKAKLSRLRECSQYFETCMSERWTQSKSSSKTKFYLEVQTEVRYYQDCFSRMHFLFKPIASVTCCIELLKVASQIGYQDVIDIGVKYLTAAPWSHDEEKLVRDFCNSGQLVPCDSLSDLDARLDDLPIGVEEKQEKLSLSAMNLLSRYLRNAIPDGLSSIEEVREESNKYPESRKKFAGAFHLIVSGSQSGVVCDKVLQYGLALVSQESVRLLSCLKKESNALVPASAGVRNAVSDFCWLFNVVRKSNAAQAIVELLINDVDALCVLYDGFNNDGPPTPLWAVKKWARMIYKIFLDVLEGKLFLKSSQRITLFREGRWLLFDKFLDLGEAHIAELVTRFITTLPQQQQEDCWMGTFIDHLEGPSCEAHMMWISHMVTKKAKRQPELSGSSDKDSSRSQE